MVMFLILCNLSVLETGVLARKSSLTPVYRSVFLLKFKSFKSDFKIFNLS